jgi:hypothetical protein
MVVTQFLLGWEKYFLQLGKIAEIKFVENFRENKQLIYM